MQNEKLPPHSIEAERAVIGSLIVSSNAIVKVVDILRPESFYNSAHKAIYSAILKMFNDNLTIDVITLSEYLKDSGQLEKVGNRSYINDLAIDVISTANVEYYARIISENYKLRELIKVGSRISNLAYDKQDPVSILNTAEKFLFNVASKSLTSSLEPIKEFSLDIWNDIENNYNNRGKVIGIPSGFYDLDTLTGGFQKSDLIIIAGRPSMGKTAFVVNIAQEVAINNDIPVAVFSLEMSKNKLGNRMFFSDAEINLGKYKNGNLDIDDWNKLSLSMAKISESPIFIDDKPFQTMSDIRAKCKKLQMEHKDLGLVVIDYLQLIVGDKEGQNRAEEVSKISRSLKGLAKELDVPVIALSQLSRKCEERQNKRPVLSDLRESGSIEQDADIVMFLYRDEYYNEKPESRGKAELIVAKHRDGEVGTVDLLFQPNLTKFKNPVKLGFTK